MATLARGTKVQRETGATGGAGPWTTIPGVKNIAWANPTSQEVDVTDQDSPGRSAEFLIGQQDFGEVTFDGNYEVGASTVHATLIADRDANPPNTWWYRILLPGGTTAPAQTFQAFVSGFDRSADITGAIQFNARLRVTGLPLEDTTP